MLGLLWLFLGSAGGAGGPGSPTLVWEDRDFRREYAANISYRLNTATGESAAPAFEASEAVENASARSAWSASVRPWSTAATTVRYDGFEARQFRNVNDTVVLVDARMNWFDARAQCHAMRRELLSISTVAAASAENRMSEQSNR